MCQLMCHLKLRFLVVALIAFALGVGAVSLLNAFRSAPVRLEDVPAPKMSSASPPPAYYVSAVDEDSSGCATTREAWEQLYRGTSQLGKPVISGGVLQGKAISKPQPTYPPIAKAARASGTVTVQIIVGEEGQVIAARSVSGHPLLQHAAVKAACQTRFSPTLLSGQPVKVSGTMTYNFVLQ